ncbi:MAG: DUF4169 family protein [Sphingomonas sp.]
MGEIINLRRARKAKAQSDAATAAAANRAAFGRTKGEKAADAADRARMEAVLRGARIAPKD